MDWATPPRARLAAVEHDGRVVLRPGAGRRAGLEGSGDPQYGSGLPVPPARRSPTGCWVRACASRWTAGAAFLDNIFIERLWRSLKYEAVYLYELRDGLDAQRIIGSWIDFYNEARPPLVAGRTDAGRGLSRRRGGVVRTIRRDATQPAQRRLRSSRDLRAALPSVFPSGTSPDGKAEGYIQTGLEGEHPASSGTATREAAKAGEEDAKKEAALTRLLWEAPVEISSHFNINAARTRG